MDRWIKAVAAVSLLLATGCETTNPQVAAQQDNQQCSQMGYLPGKPGYSDCLQNMNLARQNRIATQNQAVAAALIGAAVVGTAVVVAANNPPPRYWCNRYRCYYY